MPDTQDISARRASLSAEQRARLQQRLRGANAGANTATHQAESTIAPRPHRDCAPLSSAQRRQWFLWKLDPARTAYHLSGGLVLTGALDTAALRASVQALVDRHESLRTVFREEAEEGDGGAEQVIQEAAEVALPCIDLSALDTQARAEAVRQEVQRIRTEPFDLTRGPLMRTVLLKTGAQAHQLLVVMHHIVSDGWSVQLSLDELAAQYAARVQGRAPALPALPVQYADYAVWQNQWLDGGEGERQLAWWRDHLGTEQPVISLQTDRPRNADGRYGSARVTVAVPARTVARLRQQAQGQGATLFMALLAGFNAWLFRHTGQTDARVGVPIANRNRAETAGVVGFFVNTQVLRARISARTTLAELLLQTRDTAIGAQTHQDLPFEQLVGALRPERSLSANPLFQVMFNHVRRDHRSLADWPDVSVERLDFEEEDAQFELTLQTLEFEDGRVEATFLYAAELFDRQTVERMAGHYLAVLEALAEQPQLAVGDVALVGAAERAQLVDWSENTRRHEGTQPVHRQIEAHAKSKPLAPALVFGDEALSYAELNARANRLAHRLITLGVGPDVLVGICVERSTEMMVGILAILKAGGAYVPLDPEYPADRLSYMVDDSGIELLLTQSHLRSLIPGTETLQVLDLNTLDTSAEPEFDPQVALHGEHLAYVIYTSGSTGRPKGAAIRHTALFSCMAWMQEFYKLAGEDTVLHKAPFGFDVSVWEMFWPLTSGAKLVIANPGDHRDPVRLVELIQQHQVTTLNFVPSMLQAFLAYEGIEATTKLKHIICGGEAMPAATQREALQRLSCATLQNLYGPTETTIHVTQWTCRDDGSTQVPIGRPISDTQAYVLDASLNEVPVGVAGELYLGGINLARGYLRRAALTAERFIAANDGQRLYRTGDLVRWNNDGQLEYLGRIDHQVKVRGFRIELGEIEAQLQAQPEVREAVVVANEGPAGARLVGYVSGQGIDTAVLRERLAEALPDYMVPSVIMVLEALPLNANGKVDRKALPAPEFTSDQAYEAPEGNTEQALAAIWADVLGVARVGRHDNFFALGGDSILSLKVTARAARAGVHLTPRQMFAHQSVARIAHALEGGGSAPVQAIPVLGVAQRAGTLALSHAQMRQWFLWQLDPQSTAYHISGALKLAGQLDAEALRASFDTLVHRHASLRTVFRADAQGLAEQIVQPAGRLDLSMLDLAALGSQAERDAERDVRAQQEALRLGHTPFDLSEGPLLRVGLIRLAAEEHMLVVVMHHIVSDGWSMQVLVNEFVALYRARVQGTAASLPVLPIEYADYAAWQRDWLEAGERDRQLAYWTQQLGTDQPVLQLPTDHARKADGRYSAVRHGFELPHDLVRRLHKRLQGEGATLFMGLLAAFQVLLSRCTGEPDIRVGVPIANRHRAETEGMIGFFVNTQVLRTVLDSRESLQQVLSRARGAALGAQAHQDLPFEQLVEALQPERSLSASPLFQVMFNHQRGDLKALQGLPGLTLTECDLGAQSAQFELTLETSESDDGSVRASFSYAQELFAPQTIARMAGHYLALLEALADRPRQAVRDVALLSPSEQCQLRTWSENTRCHGDVAPVHRLIERQAAQRPDAVALVFGDQSLSYGELNARANRLAHRLISMGVRPEVLVGIAVERSIEMVVGILAIVKAGGAYVPLDPDYPADRLTYMLEDSGIAMLLTQSHLRGLLGAGSAQVLELDTLDVSSESATDPKVELHGDNLAYVIYTSGSTGRPKGAANRHRSLFNRLSWMQEAYSLGEADTVLQKTPFSFDVSVWEFFWPLMHGARLVVANPGDHRDPAKLVDLIKRHQVDTLHFVPSMLKAFLAYEGASECTSLKRIVCSGEALPAEARDQVFAKLPKAGLYNLYGPTEAAIDVTHWTCRDDGSTLVPIGRPISQTQAYVLDASLNEVPVGVAGELYLGGINLARGYLKRAGLTAERFIATDNGERLYRTGDLVRWSNEGQLEYLGRIDHQVKVRGFRIELGEIEAQLQSQPEVREAVVVADEGPVGARLVGYVSGQGIDTAVLRERLAEALPDYMVPSVLMVLNALPLNANGKVDRKALPAPEFTSDRAYEAPEGEVEHALAGIWAEVLGVDSVGRSDNFFELGGHSLLALRLLESVRAKGWTVQVRTLFQHPQLAAFAQVLLQEQGRVEVVVPRNGIPADCEAIKPSMLTLIELDAAQIDRIEANVEGGVSNIQDIYPLAPLQEGMLFHHLLQTEGDAYITSHSLGFDSKQRLERFVESFNQVIARHDILRTAVLWEGLKEPVQVVHRHAELKLQWLDVDSENATSELSAYVDPAHYRIDVQQAPMIRAVAAHDAVQQRWLLQLPSHHMVLDHTTLDFLVEEISLIQQGRHQDLPEPVPFRNYVAQARLGVSQAEHEAFFTQMLGDVDEPTAPFNLLDVQGDGTRVQEARLKLEPQLALQIRREAQRHGVSAATLFHLAWALVLAKSTGKDDVVFGTVLFGRMQGGEGAQRALGLFINTLPLRVKLGARGVAQCVNDTHAALTQLLHHEHANLSLAQRCSALPGGTPLFSALLNYRYNPQQEKPNHSAFWEGMEIVGGQERTNYPFDMSVDDLGEGFELVAQIHEAVSAHRVCGLLHAAVASLAHALAHQPARCVCELDILPTQELRQLAVWGDNKQTHPNREPVHRAVERHATQQPHAPALVLGNETLSYQEFNAQANRVAHRLISLGVRPESRVGIAVERSIGMMVGILAILKAGAAYVPLDPGYPADRLAYMIADSGIALLLTQSQSQIGERLAIDTDTALATLELDTENLGSEPAANPQVALHGESLAYLIYTSGSTGRPKGVGISHGALTAHSHETVRLFGLTPADRMLQFSTLNFDGFIEQTFAPLLAGAAIVLRGPALWDSATFHRELIERQISVADLTTAYWLLLAQDFARHGARSYGALRQVHAGGEAMPPEGLNAWRKAGLGHVRLINTYGPTEATVTASVVDCTPYTQADVEVPQRMPIGVPLAGRALRVVGPDLGLVAQGAVGELCIGGALLARGYLGRAALSAERFVADPFDTQGGRLYRTGDLVRWNDQGQLEYLGRIDHQVKVRGFRIELGEVEAQLLAQPEVREAVVVANDGAAGARLVGYVSGQGIDTALLRRKLGEALPDYMVPAVVVALDALPLNANGKVDRKALPAPEFDRASGHDAPQGALEEALAAIWGDVLGVARVGRGDNFFELGGHSLLALRLLERVRAAGWSVQVRTLFQHPKLDAFALALQQEQTQGRAEVVVPPNGIPKGCKAIEPGMLTLIELDAAQIARIESAVPGSASNIQDIYPLAPLQEGMLFHHQLQSRGDAYVTPLALSFDSKERLGRFVDCFNEVIARHDILRTAVLWEGLKEPVQVVHRHAELKLQWLQAGDAGVLDQLNAYVDPMHYRIDVRQAPMIRAVAAHDPVQQRWLLQLPSHHMVLDHTTLDFLVEEISLIQQGRHSELPEPVPFRNYVAQARLGVSQAEHEAFFTQMLGDVDEPTAPFNLLDVQGDGTRVEEARLKLEPQLALQIRREAQRHGVSAATLFHLAWALVLAKATGKDDVVFGTVLFGRMQGGEGAQRALGLFINTLPLRVKLGARGVAQCVKDTHATLTQLLHHEHANLSLAQRCSALPGGTPLFSALLNFRYSPEPVEGQEAGPLWDGMEVLGGEERTNYPFVMSVDDLGQGFELVAQINEAVDAQRVCGYMHAALRGMVESLAGRSRQPVSDIEVMDAQETSQLALWSENMRCHGDVAPVHRLIERQAERRPDAVALVFGDRSLSYGELNARANRLAHRLISLGVGPEVLVGIAVERSIEMVVGILAIVKAGGAYVPLDPDYPADRLTYMLEDSGIAMLLTQSHLQALLGAGPAQVLELDTLDVSSESTADPKVELHGDNLAYVIYTSGSTGRPKGAANRHRSLFNRLAWMQEAYSLGEADTVLQKTPFSFDVSVWEFFWPLMQGAKLVLANPGNHRDPARLVDLITRHQVNTLHFVPSMLQAFLAYEGAKDCTSLTRIVCSGEALPAEARDQVFAKLPQAGLYNLYGPTEAAIDVTHWTCMDDGSTQVPIGRPISDTQTYVLDTSLNEVPVGVAGELYLGGINLARGYLKRASLTAERFIAANNGQRLYRTGDLVRWSSEGQLEYLGRTDHQVKVRGFRIELGEIEAQLQSQPEVREAVVVANEVLGGTRLVGYVSGEGIDIAALRERLAEALPDYMVPSVLMVLDALPLNANGKVDRKALPTPEFTSDKAYETPEGEVEHALAAIWSEVLGVPRVGRSDNFFELGGHSLLAAQTAARVQSAMQMALAIKDVFLHPVLADMARLIADNNNTKPADQALSEIDSLLDSMEAV